MTGQPRRGAVAACHVGVWVMVLLAAGCATPAGAGTTVGALSSTSPRLCVAGPNAAGDCFSWASTQPVLGRARLGDCVVVSTHRRPGSQLATDLDSVDPRDWPQACPLPLAPDRSAEPSSCGWLFEASIESRDGKSLLRLTAGACAGHLDPQPSLPVWVHPGDRIVVGLAGGQAFTDDLPRPHSSDAGVLRPTSSPSRQAAWEVSRPGRAQLVVATPFCGSFAGQHSRDRPPSEIRLTRHNRDVSRPRTSGRPSLSRRPTV